MSFRISSHRNGRVVVLGVTAIASAAFAFGQSWEAVPLGTLGSFGSTAFGVNDAGDVVGASNVSENASHAFIWSAGVMTDLGTLTGGTNSSAHGINNHGLVVGRSQNAAGVDRAVKWERDAGGTWQITDLGTLRPDDNGFGWASRVNDAGQIVGYATSAGSSAYHAFLWTNGVMIDLGTLHFMGNFAYSQGLGLNNAGQTVGFAYATLQGPEHGFFHNGSQQIDITPTGQSLAQGHNVNSTGFIAGYISSSQTSGLFRAGVYSPVTQTWTLIDPLPGTHECYGYDINESGQVVGASIEAGLPSTFLAFFYDGQTVVDLNDVTTGSPGSIAEARDITDNGYMAASADTATGSMALLLRPQTDCPGDLNSDHSIGLGDLTILLSHFGTATGADPADGDLDGDHDVDLSDLTAFLSRFGTVCR